MFTTMFWITLILLMLRINLLTRKKPQTNIQTFISELFIKIVRLSWYLGTFHIFIFPVRCIKRDAVWHCTIHEIDFHQQMRTVLVLPQNDLIWKFMKGLHGFILNWTFLNFLDFFWIKTLAKRKKLAKIVSTNKTNP